MQFIELNMCINNYITFALVGIELLRGFMWLSKKYPQVFFEDEEEK